MRGSTNEIEIEATPEDVSRVLRDPRTYPSWLVGAQAIRSIDAEWPEVGAKFHHRIGVGPLTVPGSTSVLRNEVTTLELAAGMGPLGEARVRFDLEPAGDGVRLRVEEEPRRGPVRHAWRLFRPLINLGLWGRNAISLESLRHEVLHGNH